MKKIFIIIFIIFITNSSALALNNIYSDEYVQKFQNFLIIKERFNAIYYNALQMTPEQIEEYKNITECNDFSKELSDKIMREIRKYNTMKECNLPYSELKNQRQLINKLYRQIKIVLNKEDRQLKKILTREQRWTYNTIKHLERNDIKKHPKNYYKLNPKMSVFGNLKE